MSSNSNKTVKFKKPIKFNIGIVFIIIIFIYVSIYVFSYATDKNISVYEVNNGSINSSNQYNALAIREEEIVKSPQSGMIKYYKQNNSRVGVKSLLFSIDTQGDLTNKIYSNNNQENVVSDAQVKSLYSTFNDFVYSYTDSNFYKTSLFKSSLNTHLNQISTNAAMTSLSNEIAAAEQAGTFKRYYGEKAGLFLLSIDGCEDLRIDNFNKDSFDVNKSNKINLADKNSASEGDAIYKLITSDIWHLVIPLNKDDMKLYEDEKYINVRFKLDDVTSYAASSVIKQGSKNYLVLEFDDSVDRYADIRFVPVELLLDNESGLKIPNSAIVEKEFYTIPKTYFLKGDDSNSLGVMVQKATGTEFVKPTIFKETDDFFYIDNQSVSSSDYIVKPNSNEKYRVDTATDKLTGVYNVNKGYAVFKQIEILNFNNEYSIIKTGTNYGVALYDRIVLDGDSVEENEMI